MTYVWLNLKEQLAGGAGGQVLGRGDCTGSLFSLADEHTKAVTVCHVDSGNGYRHDLKTIGTWCREHRIPFGVDATQACGAMQLDVKDMKIDFLTHQPTNGFRESRALGLRILIKTL